MNARVTQLPVETLVKPERQRVRLSQLPIEVLYTLRVLGSVRVSQYAVEVLMGNTAQPTKKKYGPFVQCV